jgi:hypothetical protein
MPRWLAIAIVHFLVSTVLVVWFTNKGMIAAADSAEAPAAAMGLPIIFEMLLAIVTLVLELPVALPLLLLAGALGPSLLPIQCANSALWGLAIARLSSTVAEKPAGID